MKGTKAAKIAIVLVIISILILVMLSALCEQAAWDCPECGRIGNTGNFCGTCAHPAPEAAQAFGSASAQTPAVSSDRAPRLATEFYPNGIMKKQYEWIVLEVNKEEKRYCCLASMGWTRNRIIRKTHILPGRNVHCGLG